MKHVKSATRPQIPVKATAWDPYQEKKSYILAPFCPNGFTK